MMGHKISFNGENRMIIPKIILVTPSYLENWARRCMTQVHFLELPGEHCYEEKKKKGNTGSLP